LLLELLLELLFELLLLWLLLLLLLLLLFPLPLFGVTLTLIVKPSAASSTTCELSWLPFWALDAFDCEDCEADPDWALDPAFAFLPLP